MKAIYVPTMEMEDCLLVYICVCTVYNFTLTQITYRIFVNNPLGFILNKTFQVWVLLEERDY